MLRARSMNRPPILAPRRAAIAMLVTVVTGTVGFTVGTAAPASKIPVREHAAPDPFLGSERFESQTLFVGERFPNIVALPDGSVVAIWGGDAQRSRATQGSDNGRVRSRRSADGGRRWEPEVIIAPGFHSGGAVVDERSGDLLVFVEERHPPAPLAVFRSKDGGRTWKEQSAVIAPDRSGRIPSMAMNEHGITLHVGARAGRLLRPSRYYGPGNDREHWPTHFTNAIYSDDGGLSWKTSEPFPANGTGEAAIVELSDGTIYYNSRRHFVEDGPDPRRRYIARSRDGGETWQDLAVCPWLPDGETSRDYGLMAGLVRLPVRGRDILLFSNIDSDVGRKRGTVWASFDGGATWPVRRLVSEGPFAYSSLTAGFPGTASEGWIYLLFEAPGANGVVEGRMIRFNLSWVLAGRQIDSVQEKVR